MPTKASTSVSITGALGVRAAVSRGRTGPVTERLVASAVRFCGAAIDSPSRAMRRSYRRKRTAERKVQADRSPPMPAQRIMARSSPRRSFSLAAAYGLAVIPSITHLAFITIESPTIRVGGDCTASSSVTNLATAITAVSRTPLTCGRWALWSMAPRSISGGRCTFSGIAPARALGTTRPLGSHRIRVTVCGATLGGRFAVFSICGGGTVGGRRLRSVPTFSANADVTDIVPLAISEASCRVFGLVRYYFRAIHLGPVVCLHRILQCGKTPVLAPRNSH